MNSIKTPFLVLLILLSASFGAVTAKNKNRAALSSKNADVISLGLLGTVSYDSKAEILAHFISDATTLSELSDLVKKFGNMYRSKPEALAMNNFLRSEKAGVVILAKKKEILTALQKKLDHELQWTRANRVDLVHNMSITSPSGNINGRTLIGTTVLVELLNFNPHTNPRQQKIRMELLREMYANKAKINVPTIICSREVPDQTPLMQAAFWGNIQAVRLLLSYAPSLEQKKQMVDTVDNDKKSPLEYTFKTPFAITGYHVTVLKELLQAAPSLEIIDHAIRRLKIRNLAMPGRNEANLNAMMRLLIAAHDQKISRARDNQHNQIRWKFWKRAESSQ